MRFMKFALAAVLVFSFVLVAGRTFAQQQAPQQAQPQAQGQQGQAQPQQQGRGGGGGQGGGGGRGGGGQQGPSYEQQLQDAQKLVRERVAGGGGQGGGGGAAAAPAVDPDADINAYVNTTDFFSVSIPCKTMTSRAITWATEYDSKVPGNVYNCTGGDTQYEMTVINYTDLMTIRRAQEHTPAAGGDAYARIDLTASVAYASTKIRNEAAKVTYDAFHYINLIPGMELQTTLANGRRVYSAVYLHEYRLYILKATVGATGIPPLLYTQSFAVVRPDGSAIRYPTIYRHPW